MRRQVRPVVRRSLARLQSIKASMRPGQRLICIGLIEHFGDIVACEPVIRHVRARNPDAYLVWLVREPYRELVAFHPELDEVLLVTCMTEYSLLVEAEPADEFIDLHVNLRACTKFGFIHRKRRGDTTINVSNYYSHGGLMEAFCKSAGLPPLTEGPQLHLPSTVRAEVDTLVPAGPFILIHASSNETARDWQTTRWVELIGSLASASGVGFIEVGLKPLVAGSVPGVVDLCGRLSLPQLAEVIRRSVGFIGMDSGPAHMANAFSRPSVILMGSYRAFDRYMPYSGFLHEHAKEMLIRWDGPAALIPVDVVAERVRRNILSRS